MTDQIKTVKSAHRVLVLVCFVLLAVSSSAFEQTRYRAALEEIKNGQHLLANIDWWETTSQVVDNETTSFNQQAEQIWDRLGLEPVPSELRSGFVLKQKEPPLPTTVDELLSNFDKLSVTYFSPDFEDLERHIRDDQFHLKGDIKWVEIYGFDGIRPVFQDHSIESMIASNPELLPIKEGEVTAIAEIWVYGSTEQSRSVHIGPVRGELKTTAIDTKFIRQIQQALKLPGPIDSKGRAFSATKSVWHKISGLTLGEAEAALVALSETAAYADPVPILGIQIPGSLIGFVAPLVIIVVLLYLLSHLTYLNGLISNAENAPDNLVWIGLFKSKLALFLTFSSIVILPIVTSFLLTWGVAAQSVMGLFVAILVAIFVAIASVFVWQRLAGLRKKASLPCRRQ